MFTWRLCSNLCLLVVLTAAQAAAQPAPTKPGTDENPPTRITSKTMTVKNQEGKAIFQGEVVMIRGALTVHSDEMIVYFRQAAAQGGQSEPSGEHANGKSTDAAAVEKAKRSGDLPTMSNRSVSMIEAIGSVVIEKDEGRATCRKAIYYESEGKIVLTGNPIAWQKGTRVSGEKMTMYLADDRSVVEGGTQVVIEEAGKGAR